MAEPKLWEIYEFRGYRVEVTQRWTDPFGCPMVGIRLLDIEDEEGGLPERVFLAEAARLQAGA